MSTAYSRTTGRTWTDEPQRSVVCPCCAAALPFRRSVMPSIDSAGFESYSLECHACGAQLAGVIDPADDALLLVDLMARI